MRTGTLDRRITLQRPPVEAEVDAVGQPTDAWVTVATVWAEVIFGGGSESFEADQTAARQRVTFRIRFRRGVSPEMRVVLDGNVYQVEDVAEPKRREELVLTCFAIAAVPGGRT